jgi:hypothetical protein
MRKRAGLWTFRSALVIIVLLVLILPASSISAANPVINTLAPTETTENSAILNGNIVDFGTFAGPYVYLSFQYCTDDYFTISGGQYDKRTTEQSSAITNGITTFSATITGLAYSSEYHYRAVLRFGTSYAYGVDTNFNTAMLSPDTTPGIISFYAYKNLMESNDCLFVIYANIPYSIIPGIPINRSFIWSLIDTGTEKGWNTGYAMNDNGYGYNVYSLYFNAAASITWADVVKYNIQLAGSPSVFYGPVPIYDDADSGDYLVAADTWVASSDYHVTLAADIITIAKSLEQEWQVVLLDEQDTKTVLSSNGEKLFRNAIPGIQSMAPSLFYVQNVDADVSKRTWGTSLDDAYKGRLLGPDGVVGGGDDSWIALSLEPLADWLNIPWLMLIGLLTLAVCVFVIYKSNQRFGSPLPGYIGAIIVVMCSAMLAMGLTALAIMGMALVIAASYLIFLRRA